MPIPLDLPYPPLVLVESDNPIEWDFLIRQINDRLSSGVSICLITTSGNPDRGGYFFHFKKFNETIVLSTFDRHEALSFDNTNDFTEFINHASGREYSSKMWKLSQFINLRTDGDSQ